MTKITYEQYGEIVDSLAEHYCPNCNIDEDCKIVNCILEKTKKLLKEHLSEEEQKLIY